jgi:hypothetical protein
MSTATVQIIFKGVDEATEVAKAVAQETDGAIRAVEERTKQMLETQDRASASTRDMLLAFNNLAAGAFTLYGAVDRVMDMHVQLHAANLRVNSSANTLADTQDRYRKAMEEVEEAQRKYNNAVEKYGADSSQAAAAASALEQAQRKLAGAARDVEVAQERYNIAVERANMIQGNLNEAVIQGALTVIPTSISAFSSLGRMVEGFSGAATAAATITNGLSGAMSFLAANPAVLVAAAIAGLVAILVTAYQTCEPFREAVNKIAEALGGVFRAAIEGAMAVVQALGEVWGRIVAGIMATWSATVGPLVAAIEAFAEAVMGVFRILLGWLLGGSLWPELCGGLVAVWNSVVMPLVGTVRGFANALVSAFTWLRDAVGAIWGGIVSATQSAVSTIASAISSGIGAAVSWAKDAVGSLASSASSTLSSVWDKLSSAGAAVASFASSAASIISSAVSSAASSVASTVSSAVGGISQAAAEASNAVSTAVASSEGIAIAAAVPAGGTEAVSMPTDGVGGGAKTLPPDYALRGGGGGGKAYFMQEGGIVKAPTFALLGEAGPEAVIPLSSLWGFGAEININAPLVYVEGSADRRTVEEAAERIREELRSVIIEATSSGAPAAMRRIRAENAYRGPYGR